MSRTMHLYLDESVRSHAGGTRILLVGGLLFDRPLEYRGAEWYHDLLRHPHATDRPDEQRDRQGRVGRPVWEALGKGQVRGGSMTVLAVKSGQKGGGTDPRAYEAAYLGLVLEVIARTGLREGDALHLYPERWGPGGDSALVGRFEGIAGALRWIANPAGGLPAIRVTGMAKDPNMLVGQAFVDLILWNLGAPLQHDTREHWQDALRAAAGRLELLHSRHFFLSLLPPLTSGTALAAWAARRSGRLVSVDWLALARDSDDDVLARIRKGWDSVRDPTRIVDRALDTLEPLADNPARASHVGVEPVRVVSTLGVLERGVARLPAGIASRRLRRRYALAQVRALSHVGQVGAALQAWERWDGAMDEEALVPEALDERLRGINAKVVILTDLERWAQVEALVERQLQLIERHYQGFERIPTRGRAIGALAQARVLGQRWQPDDVFALLESSKADLRGLDAWSYPWTWALIAMGRGAPDPDITAQATALFEQLDEAYGDTLAKGLGSARHAYLRWGLAEAMLRPEVAEVFPPALRQALEQVMQRLARHRRGRPEHPDGLALRAYGLWSGSQDALRRAGARWSIDTDALATGEVVQRMALRTQVAWLLASGASEEAREQIVQTRMRVAAALERIAPELDAVASRLRAFLAFDLRDEAGARAFMALGGY